MRAVSCSTAIRRCPARLHRRPRAMNPAGECRTGSRPRRNLRPGTTRTRPARRSGNSGTPGRSGRHGAQPGCRQRTMHGSSGGRKGSSIASFGNSGSATGRPLSWVCTCRRHPWFFALSRTMGDNGREDCRTDSSWMPYSVRFSEPHDRSPESRPMAYAFKVEPKVLGEQEGGRQRDKIDTSLFVRIRYGVPSRSRTCNLWLRRTKGRAQTLTSQALTAAFRAETEGCKGLTSH